MNPQVACIESPIGLLKLGWEGDALCALSFLDAARSPTPVQPPEAIRHALLAYFSGDLAALDSVPVLLRGSPFQNTVWTALRLIPPGATISYGELARRIGQPRAFRAVGLANGANPIAIVVPCHRVIGSDGKLTGYGGGLDRKRWLLDHERGATPLPLHNPSPAP